MYRCFWLHPAVIRRESSPRNVYKNFYLVDDYLEAIGVQFLNLWVRAC